MNLKKDTTQIDGPDGTAVVIKTEQFPAMRAFRLLGKLLKTIGPALGVLAKLDPKTQLQVMSAELAGAFASLDPDEATRMLPEILERTTASDGTGKHLALNTSSNIDLVFSGNLKGLFTAVGFVLGVNYGDFTAGSVPDAPQPQAPSVS